MSEKMIFYNVQTDLIYSDYFDLELDDGIQFRWKNFGQVITLDGKDAREQDIEVSGIIIPKEEFSTYEQLGKFKWLVDAYEFGYGKEESILTLNFPNDNIKFILHKEYKTRLEEYPEQDYFYWVNEYVPFGELISRLDVTEDKAINYLLNWRRPKLKTNNPVAVAVWQNEIPIYVGMLDAEKKKSSVDAFFRLIYFYQYLRDR